MEAPAVARIQFLGGAVSIGASCALLELDDLRLVIDCGVRVQGPQAERLPHLAALEDGLAPSAILVTHAHLDHIGALPVLVQRFPAVPVFATPPTIALMRIQLLDALKIMEQDSEAEGEVPLYSRGAVETLLARTVPVRPYAPFEIVPGGPRATYYLAGHILGACAIGVEGRAGRVLFTGDVSTSTQRTIPGMTAPHFRPHLVVCESTYGARLHAARAAEEERLVRMAGETIASGGKVLVPAFAIGRAQEVILTLIQAMLTKKLPPFPVHVDGLVRNVCQVYRDFPAYLQPRLKRRIERFGDPFFDVLENVRPVAGEKRREEILNGPPCAVVASSGMLTGGASPIYARALVGGPEHLIAITGYQDEESPGRKLLDAAEGKSPTIPLGGRETPVRCRVEKYALSAHADGNGLANLVRNLRPADTLLVHGNPEARRELADLLARERLGRIHLPREDGALGFVVGGQTGGAADRVLVSGIGSGPLDTGALRRHILETYRAGASLPVVDLHRIWHGREPRPGEVEAFEAALRTSPDFQEDPKRPFHFEAREDVEPIAAGPLEQNALFACVDAALPADSGLLKKSFEPGIPHLTLHFDFPDRAAERHRGALDAAFAGTGWTYELHPTPNTAALNHLIDERAPDRALLARAPSVRVEERTVTLWLSRTLWPEEEAAWDEATRAIEEASGFRVCRDVRASTPAARRQRDDQGRMEINIAYRHIARAFESAPHRPSRVGLHPNKEGPVIRVAFISEEVGTRYRELLSRLEAETGWPLRLAPSADQNAILEEARRLLAPHGTIRRGPRFQARERAVEVEIDGEISDAVALARAFRERTGFELRPRLTRR